MSTTQREVASRSVIDREEPYPAEKARQGEIILKTKRARIIFFGSLFGGFAVLAILAIVLAIIP
jgi:hypothetical protein